MKWPLSKKNKQQLVDPISLVHIVDKYSTYPSRGLTPEKLAVLFREADTGDIYRQMELFEEMPEKDGHNQALFGGRRLAVTRRNYNILAASQNPKDVDIAQKVDKMIKRFRGWKGAQADILSCVPHSFSVCNLEWGNRGDSIDLIGVKYQHPKKFRFGKPSDPFSDPTELRMLLDPHQQPSFHGLVSDDELAMAAVDGVSIDNNPALRKRFIVTYCKARSGNPARTSLQRTLAYLWLFKNYDIKWWVAFAEILLGYRLGKYDPQAVDAEGQKALLERAVKGLGQDSAAVISKDSTIEFVQMAEKAASFQTFSELKNWCDDEATEVVLGHTSGTKGTPGKLGGEDMANDVKHEIIEADARVHDEAITDDIIKTWVDMNVGPQEEYPYYQTDVSAPVDLGEKVAIDSEVQKMGGKFTGKYMKETYGIPLANDDEEILTPTPGATVGATVSPATAKDIAKEVIALDGKIKLLTRR
jgi:phage gp29-like protein